MFAKLEHKEPYKWQVPWVSEEFKKTLLKEEYFEKSSHVITKYGVVGVYEYYQRLNTGRFICTQFKAVFNGMVYTAYLKEAGLSDRKLKWISSHFMKKIVMDNKL